MKTSSFEEMQRDMANGTFDLTCNGKCTGCGSCCSNILPMTEDEIRTIRQYIKRYNIKEQKRLLPTVNANLDMICPFLDNSKKFDKCMIYKVRPKICRDFICDPKQRPPVDLSYARKVRIVLVREEFYGN